MYSRNKIHRIDEIFHQCYFKSGDAEVIKNKEYSNLLYTYCYAYCARNISDRRSITSTVNLFNCNTIYWCARKQSETSRNISNSETIAIYTGVLDQNWIRDFFRSIGYPIVLPSKLYEDNQAKIRIVLADRITPQAINIDVLITDLHELHLIKKLEW